MSFVYPRLHSATAYELLAEYSSLTTAELRARSAVDHPRMEWYPTGPDRIRGQHLQDLQDIVRRIAANHGYPDLQVQRTPNYTRFDQEVGPELYQAMQIVPADAAHEGVWSFLSLVVLPDVALWRFPNRQRRDDYERIVGRSRNVFRRLWWRAYAFGPDSRGSQLLEDEAVAIMERPTLGGDPRIARAIADTHLDCIRDHPGLSRTEVMRQAMKRVRRLASVLTIGALDDSGLADLIRETFDAAMAAQNSR
jgi:Family of unknown function (DUF6339)